MSNLNKNTTSSLIKINKPFWKMNNFYFLINNFHFFWNLSILNWFCEINITIYKNKFFFKKSISYNKNLFKRKNYIFTTLFKFNKFFKFISTNSKIGTRSLILKKISSLYLYPHFFYKKKILLNRNWSFLAGYLISPYYLDLQLLKKFPKNLESFILHKNNFYFNKSKKLNKSSSLLDNQNKKIFINNYFYFKTHSFNLNNMSFFLKLKSNNKIKKTYNWLLSKPYLFLNNYEIRKLFLKYSNSFLINIFKKNLKFFNFLKKFNYRSKLKKTNYLLFKNFHSKINFLKKIKLNSNFTPFKPFTNIFSFFKYKNFFFKTPIKTISFFKFITFKKNLLKYKWIFNILLKKTRAFKKIKFFYNIKMNIIFKHYVKYESFLSNLISYKSNKRFRKLSLWLHYKKFKNNDKLKFKISWFKKFRCAE